MSTHKLRYMIYTSIVLNLGGIVCLCIAVLAKSKTHQSADFVFTMFYDRTGLEGVGWSIRASPAYVAVTGVLMSQYTILGYDASAHLCEVSIQFERMSIVITSCANAWQETRKAVRHAPIGLLSSIAVSAVLGFFVIVCLLFSIQDFQTVQKDTLPVLKIMTDACGKGGGLVLMVLIMMCIWHCGLFSLVSTSPSSISSPH